MAIRTEEEKELAKVPNSLAYSLGRGINNLVKTKPAFVDPNPPVNIYAPGSPTELAQRRQGTPGAGILGTVADTAALIPRSFMRVGDNVYRGAAGLPANNSPFVLNPSTRALTQGWSNSGTASAAQAAPAAPITPVQRGMTSVADGSGFQAQPTGIRTQAPQASTTPAAAVAAQPGAPAGMRFRSAQDSSDYQKYIGTGMSSDPSPSVHRAMLQDPATGKYSFQEIQNGTDTAPALQNPFVSAKAFRQITGYDKNKNPIYSDGSAEMNAANAGIADYNKSLMEGYAQRNAQWADIVGGVPKDIADAAKTRAETAEIPLEGSSARGLRTATAAAQGESKNKPILREIDVPIGPPNQLGESPTVRKLVSVNPETMEITELKLGDNGANAKLALYNSLTPDEQSVVAKHFGETKPTSQEFAAFVKKQFNK